MGRGRDRGPKRRVFDDDYQPEWASPPPRPSFSRSPRQDAVPSGPALEATVKWFNPEKGFGFVELADGSGDVFLHAAALEAGGHTSVDPGAKLSVQVGIGQKGRQVTAVLSVDASTAVSPRDRTRPSQKSFGRASHERSGATTVEGTMKWFNGEKGFGFVACDDGEKDVFVHVSVVARAGLRSLDEGQRLAMNVAKTPKGREAVSVTILG